ncbi:type IV fimbrial biogenesis protein FimU [Azomonas agilis]|uniref:Type II secretion system protein H n=1 Tax=Azomonas agilis TaxID=116849 RepID=A0A562HZ59_9GAMM|nr:GspH/FimT family pseudopilin [Azomonas agilis]TWH64050.1 type IV fimbrial biogenesis protein FimU [Azomonas agilis]
MISKHRTQHGFTLIELMIILVLLGIFLAIAVPSFSQFISSNKALATRNELLSLLQFARAQAATERTSIRVCSTDTGTNSKWQVQRKNCEGEMIRSLALAAGISANTKDGPTEISFHYNGTAEPSTIICICYQEDFANGYTIEIEASGNIRSYDKGHNKNTPMTSCTPS